ncbi:peptidase M14 family protein, partial [archaeon]|nr:peptidase M14 family protein [archaeon]
MTKIVTPEEFYGFKPGTDRKLVRWDKVVEYLWKLDKASDRIKVFEAGKTTMGNPMLVAYVSSKENLVNLDQIKHDTWSISHPEDLTESEVERIIKEGKSVVAMTMSIHASEVGGTQMVSDFTYNLLTSEEPLEQRIRDNVVLVLFPCANPDGQIMTVDWYNEYLGTEFEGGGMPWLYHKYVGHDNNRDALTLTQVETQIMNKIILKEWFPQAYLDIHQMGFYGSRFFIPPNSNPVNEVADPLVWVEQKHYGAQMAIRMESEGIIGVEQAAVFPADFMPGFSLVFPWFNICGMFTESS